MPSLLLAVADIALFSDPEGTRVELPYLIDQTPSWVADEAAVRFDGDADPTVYRGDGLTANWQLQALFTPDDHAGALALLDLFVAARSAADGRLQLRTTGAYVAGLDDLQVVTVATWTPTRLEGGALQIDFQARRVYFTVEV